jgi:hypothetical protein
MSEAEVPYAASTAEQDGGDDQFILEWVRQELGRGEFPTGRSLEGQRLHQMRPLRDMTQKRVRDALSRLKAASRIVDSDMKAPSGNKYLCVHETSTA